MKKYISLALAAVAIFASCSTVKQPTPAAPVTVALNAASDSACYAVGVNYGAGLRESMNTFPGGTVNLDALKEGFLKAFDQDSTLRITPNDAQTYIQSYVAAVQAREAEAAKTAEKKFFDENKTKAGVVATASGLQYQVIQEGKGDKPTTDNQVKVHYTGRLLDGTVFDSSVERGEPATFGVTQVIKGWTEVLQLMTPGSKYKVWIPAELAYGAQGAGQMIKPNSTLEFEIELIEVVK